MAGGLEKGLYVKVPAPTRDAYLVAGMAILLRVSRNAVHNGASSRGFPPPGRMTGRKRGASRSGTSFSSGASGTRVSSLDAEAMGLAGGFLVLVVRR